MGNIQADFMQTACAAEVLVPQGKLLNGYVFGVAQAVHKGLRGIGNNGFGVDGRGCGLRRSMDDFGVSVQPHRAQAQGFVQVQVAAA